jgi:hypothetical protein
MTGIRNIDTDSDTSETLIDIKEVTDFIEQTRSDAIEFIKTHEIHDIGNTIAGEFDMNYWLEVRTSQPNLKRVRGFLYYPSESECKVIVGEYPTSYCTNPSKLSDTSLEQAVHLLAERDDECREKAAEFVQSELTDVAEIAEVLPDASTQS